MKKISLIIPVHNEEKNIPLIYSAITVLWKENLTRYDYEILFINDGSTDSSAEVIEALSSNTSESKVKFVDFSRNFGKEAATSAGLHEATGDAAIMLDADMQHPVELLPQFIESWEKGNEVVIGIRTKNTGEGFIKKAGSYFFYKMMKVISETEIIPRETDFRLIDRKVIEAFKGFTERDRITRGLIDWLGFRRDYINFIAPKRANGKATYSSWMLLKLALSSFVGHSLFPLKFAGYLGVIITVISGALGLFIFIEKYVLDDILNLAFSGPAILAVINLFLVGIILSCLGLIAIYIGIIKNETSGRPLYVVRKIKP